MEQEEVIFFEFLFMNAKPSDFFLNIIDFFGIVIPGAIFYFFYGGFLFQKLNLDLISIDNTGKFIVIFCTSYVLGHFLFGFSVRLNRMATYLLDNVTKHYFNCVYPIVILPAEIKSKIKKVVIINNKGVKKKLKNFFGSIKAFFIRSENNEYIGDVYYSAFSYLRLNNPNALVELERQAAEYKLFRSLTLLFTIDFVLTSIDCFYNFLPCETIVFRPIFSLLAAFLTFRRFDFLFDWTYRLTFDFFLQVPKKKNDKNEINATQSKNED